MKNFLFYYLFFLSGILNIYYYFIKNNVIKLNYFKNIFINLNRFFSNITIYRISLIISCIIMIIIHIIIEIGIINIYYFFFYYAHYPQSDIKFRNEGFLLNISYINILLIYLTSYLFPICILLSKKIIIKFHNLYYLLLFILYIILLLIFLTNNILLFFILFESTLIPLFIIIGIWGNREEKYKAAYYFFFYTFTGSILMLIGILKIYELTGTFNIQILNIINLPDNIQFLLFITFILAFIVKLPLFPFHIWLPQAHVEGPISASILLAGILLKLGGYGIIKFVVPLFPIACLYFKPLLITLSILSIIFSGLSTIRQSDIKRLIAYSSISHMGLVMLGIFSLTNEGILGAIYMMFAHGLVSSGMFIIANILYNRTHTRIIRYYRGFSALMPLLASITFIITLCNIGFPIFFNFIAEVIIIKEISKQSLLISIFTCTGLLISATYSFYLYNRIFFGQVISYLYGIRDLSFTELIPLIVIITIITYCGFHPYNLVT